MCVLVCVCVRVFLVSAAGGFPTDTAQIVMLPTTLMDIPEVTIFFLLRQWTEEQSFVAEQIHVIRLQ